MNYHALQEGIHPLPAEAILIEPIGREGRNEWDALVQRAPQGGLFQRSDWLQALRQALPERETRILGCFRKGQLIGGCPFSLARRGRFFSVASTNAGLAPYGGPVWLADFGRRRGAEEFESASLLDALARAFERAGFSKIELYCSPELQDARPFLRRGWRATPRYAYWANPSDPGWAPNARRYSRKAQSEGIDVELSTKIEGLDAFWEATFLRQNMPPPISRASFARLFGAISAQDCARLHIARSESGEVAAMEIFLLDLPRKAHRWASAVRPEWRSSGAALLALEKAFGDLAMAGIEDVNMQAGNYERLARFVAGNMKTRRRLNFLLEKSTPAYEAARLLASWRRRR